MPCRSYSTNVIYIEALEILATLCCLRYTGYIDMTVEMSILQYAVLAEARLRAQQEDNICSSVSGREANFIDYLESGRKSVNENLVFTLFPNGRCRINGSFLL